MSDICAAIASDIANYRFLCQRYDEPIQYKRDAYGHEIEDCYGDHFKALDKRFNDSFTLPERITGWWNYNGHVLVKPLSRNFHPAAYIRQDLVEELAKAFVDIYDATSVTELVELTGLTPERCYEIKEIALTYMED